MYYLPQNGLNMIPDLLQYTTGVLRYWFTTVRWYKSSLNTHILRLNDIKKNEDMAFNEVMNFFSFKIDLGKPFHAFDSRIDVFYLIILFCCYFNGSIYYFNFTFFKRLSFFFHYDPMKPDHPLLE